MWNKPQLMTAVADLILVAASASLLVAGLVWTSRLPLFPVNDVVVTHELTETRRAEIEDALAGRLRGNFFSVNLDALRHSLERLPWVRRAEVRRQWPSSLEVTLEEHVPAAYWGVGSGQLVNTHGEIFTAYLSRLPEQPMPVLSGPPSLSSDMLGYYRQARELLAPIGREARVLTVSPRLAVQIKLDDGMLVELGRQRDKSPLRQRLERFVHYYPSVLGATRQKPSVVDMRYPNGFALRVAAAPATESKGKP